jgi:hypothetical protein
MLVQPDLLSIVASLQDAANRHAVDEVMAMFADDAGILLAGFTKISDCIVFVDNLDQNSFICCGSL